MPNEIKNSVTASSYPNTSRKLSDAGSSTGTMMIWTLSGMALAACGSHGRSILHGDLFPDPNNPSVAGFASVRKGPVKNAVVYFDQDGDGTVQAAERVFDPANPGANSNFDQNGNTVWRTDENGRVLNAPTDTAFVVVLDGATDTQSNHPFTAADGELRSLQSGGIATPITEAIREDTRDPDLVLDDLFGANRTITLADILDPDNYTGYATTPAAGSAEYNSYLIERAALALNESASTAIADRIADAADLVDATPDAVSDPSRAALLTAVNDLEDEAEATLMSGTPLAIPASGVRTDEDTGGDADGFTFLQLASSNGYRNVEELFFSDAGGNPTTGNTFAANGGLLINPTVANAEVLLSGTVLAAHVVTPPGTAPTAATGYFFVPVASLNALTIKTTANYNGTINVNYFAFDGEAYTAMGTLDIIIDAVEDAPAIAQDAYIFSIIETATAGTTVGTAITATDAEGDTFEFSISGGPFEIGSTSGEITIAANATLAAGDVYNLTVTATDAKGTASTATVRISILDNNAPTIVYSAGGGGSAQTAMIGEDSTSATTNLDFEIDDADTATDPADLTVRAAATASTTGEPDTPTYASIDIDASDTDGTDGDADVPINTLTASPVEIHGSYGIFSLTRGTAATAGELTVEYQLFTQAQNANAYTAVQNLNANEQLFDKLTVYAHDGRDGSTTPLTYTVTIDGANENAAPTVAYAASSVATTPSIDADRTAPTTVQTIDIGDADASDPANGLTVRAQATSGTTDPANLTAADFPGTSTATTPDVPINTVAGSPVTITTTYGEFSLTRTQAGDEVEVSYTLDTANTAVQALNAGDTLFDELAIFAYDGDDAGTPLHYTVTINGVNDDPTIGWGTPATGGTDPTVSGDIASFTYTAPANTGVADPSALMFTISDPDGDDTIDTTSTAPGVDVLTVRAEAYHGTSDPTDKVAADYPATTSATVVDVPAAGASITSMYGTFVLTRHATDGSLTVTYQFDEATHGSGGTSALTADAFDELAIWVDDGDGTVAPLIYEVHIDLP
jgi:VCBS repeat-containing protein